MHIVSRTIRIQNKFVTLQYLILYTMQLSIVEVKTANQRKKFVKLPAKIHKNEPNWMPTLISDDLAFFNPNKNHQFQSCDTILLLAYHNNKVVGRIMGIIHHTYNKINQEDNARFGYLDCINSQEVAHFLLFNIEKWAAMHSKKTLVGPYGFSDKDVQGLLIEGFEKKPIIDSACNPPYLVKFVEDYGFVKEIDCMTYKFSVNFEFPEVYSRVYQRALLREGIKLVEFTTRNQLKPFIEPVLHLVNRTYNNLYGFVPLSSIEIHELANRYLPIIDPRFVKLITKEEKLIAFIIAIPNFTEGIQRSGGRLFPFGFISILNSIRKSKQLDLMLGAVESEFQGNGLEVAMGLRLIDSAKEAGFQDIEVHLVLENNTKMRNEIERLQIPIYKKFRVYRKFIS